MILVRPFRPWLSAFCLLVLWSGLVFLPAPILANAEYQSPTTATSFTLTILHTNDLHGHILPFAYTETERSKTEQPSVGGATRRATLIRNIRRVLKHPSVLVDSGDTFTRGPFTNAYEGIADVEAMNAVGYELAAIGNNEFKAKDGVEINDAVGSQAALLQVVKRARFPGFAPTPRTRRGRFWKVFNPMSCAFLMAFVWVSRPDRPTLGHLPANERLAHYRPDCGSKRMDTEGARTLRYSVRCHAYRRGFG